MVRCSLVGMLCATGLVDVAIGSIIGSISENQSVTDSNQTVLDKAKKTKHDTKGLKEHPCSFQSHPLSHTIQSVAKAAGGKIYPNYATYEEMNFGVNMSGLWWMMGNVLAEEFVSWKGATSDSPNQFPMTMTAPTNLKGNWVWPDSIKGRALMSWYAVTEDPTVPQVCRWTSPTYAVITPIAGGSSDSGFQYVLRINDTDPSGDSWIRENLDSPDDTEAEYIYTLVRVVNGDGKPNEKWWPEFERYAAELGITHLQQWGNDNACMRACETLNICTFCQWWCGPPEDPEAAAAWGSGLHMTYLLFVTMVSATWLQ